MSYTNYRRIPRLFLPFTGLALLLILLIAIRDPLAAANHGPICSVDNSGNNVDYSTIQAAIQDSSCSSIHIAPGHYFENLLITRSVNILGVTSATIVIDGGGTNRVVQVLDASVTISGVSIQNGGFSTGICAKEGGAGLYNTGLLTLINSVVQGNQALFDCGYGGGIFNSGAMTITGSTVVSNTALEGGGLALFGETAIQDSLIANNHAFVFHSTGGGGGLYIASMGRSQITHTQILRNHAYLTGGGIYSEGTLDLQQSEVAYNQAEQGSGGGIVARGVMTVTQSRIDHNQAVYWGGGIYYGSDGNSQHGLTLQQSEILSNTAGDDGGGIYAAGSGGGGSQDVYIAGNLVQGNAAGNTGSIQGDGAGIYLDFGSGQAAKVQVDDNLITGNINYSGKEGGVFLIGPGITLTNNLIVGNRGAGVGLGIGSNSGINQIINNTIFGNHGMGVALSAWRDQELLLLNNIIAQNDAYGVEASTEWAAHVTVLANDLWQNGQGNYSGLEEQTGKNGNLSMPPMLANPNQGDWHLSACSTLIDAGLGQQAPATDFYGNARPYQGSWDIGASEFVGDSTCFKTWLSPIQKFFPIYITPGNYSIKRCVKKELYIRGQHVGLLTECVPNVTVRKDGFMQFNFTWTLDLLAGVDPVIKHSDADNRNMYMTDNVDNRYDHVEVGGDSAKDVIVQDNVPIQGWFLFPHPKQPDAQVFVFHDDDQNTTITAIKLTK